ncbi:hypothetical protein ACFFWD_11225 [Bradyrhizobium erythrophlei]|uniref:hypothetical protein n=1 Tax=Bradyrhizobium erythrophlei TaxID=1437360 RepID=UPI0035E6586D
MRKLLLISTFVLASATAQAGSRRHVLAANDQVPSTQAAAPAAPPQAAQVQPAPAPCQAQTQVQPQAAPADTPKPVKKTHVRRYESDEAKARRIAARYGIYW